MATRGLADLGLLGALGNSQRQASPRPGQEPARGWWGHTVSVLKNPVELSIVCIIVNIANGILCAVVPAYPAVLFTTLSAVASMGMLIAMMKHLSDIHMLNQAMVEQQRTQSEVFA